MLTPDAIALMQEYPWPGNVRELRNVIERVVLLVARRRDARFARRTSRSRPRRRRRARRWGRATTLAELERQHIEAVLTQTNWHQGHAAKMLGISSKTLYRKIREYGFQRPRGAARRRRRASAD